jgi:hypothetical protein
MPWSWTNNAFAITGGPNFTPYPVDLVVPNYSLLGFGRQGVNTFELGETLSFAIDAVPPAGTTYEVRDYFGNVVATGPADVDPLC